MHDVAVQEPAADQPDEQVAEMVRAMKADRPDFDWDNLLMGRFAGPVSEDRPDVPVWDYAALAEADPSVEFADLTAARFPVHYFEGGWSVTSIDEELKPFPTSYTGIPPKRRFSLDPMSVVRRYQALHAAGLVSWDPVARGLVHRQPVSAFSDAVRAWAEDEVRRSRNDGPR